MNATYSPERKRIPRFTRPTSRGGALAALIGTVIAVALALAPQAAADVYWGNTGATEAIGRASLDGSDVNQALIGVSAPCAIAADGEHVYWANAGTDRIGRALLNGGRVQRSFITGVERPCGLAVNDTHIYWASLENGTIGRAKLDGTDIEPSVVTGIEQPTALAVDDVHIFWTDVGSANAIGRANLNGTGADQDFIAGMAGPLGLAVDEHYIYWTTGILSQYGIGRANLNGTDVDHSFVTTGADIPSGIAVDDEHLYWSNYGNHTIARANRNGSDVRPNFVTGADGPFGIAVDRGTRPSCSPVAVATTGGEPVEVTLDCEGGGLNYALTSQPQNGQVSDFDPLEGTLTYTPDTGFAGADGFDFRATNSQGAAQAQVRIQVASDPGSESPSCSAVKVTTAHSQPVEVSLGCSGGGLTYAVAASPLRGEISGLNSATGKLTYTPGAGFRGRDSFSFTASNTFGSATDTVTIDVGAAPNSFRLGKPKRKRKKGAAKLPATVPGAGVLVLRGKGVKRAPVKVGRASTVRLPVRAKGRKRARIGATGKARVKVVVTFRPVGGDPRKLPKRIKLVKR